MHLNPNIPIFPFMDLPKDFLVDTGRLAGCFKHTSATYKFYWMLGLLAEVEQGKERVEKKCDFMGAEFISNRLSFLKFKLLFRPIKSVIYWRSFVAKRNPLRSRGKMDSPLNVDLVIN